MVTEQQYSEAHKKVEDLKNLYLHIIVYFTVNIIIYAASFYGFGLHKTFWDTSLFVTGVFGAIGVLGQWACLIGYRLIFSKKKEQSLVDKFINEEKNTGV